MRAFFTKAPFAKACKVFAPLVVSFVIGVLLRSCYPEDWRFYETTRVLGDALIVAGIIGFCIELWSTSILIDHAAEQLSNRLVGYGLPKGAQKLISELVRTKKVYVDYRVLYRIEKNPKREGYVNVYSTWSCTVVNNGTSPESVPRTFHQEGVDSPKATHLQFCGRVFDNTQIKTEKSSKTGVVSFTPPDECEGVTLRPSEAGTSVESLADDQKCFMRWQIACEMPEHYSDVVAFGAVVINPVIELISKPEDLEFHASEDDCAHEQDGQSWRYKRAYVAGQHLRVWWKPKTAQSNNPTAIVS